MRQSTSDAINGSIFCWVDMHLNSAHPIRMLAYFGDKIPKFSVSVYRVDTEDDFCRYVLYFAYCDYMSIMSMFRPKQQYS